LPYNPSKPRCGFSLLELLVVISIVVVLLGLLVAAIQRVREAANAIACRNNLKQLALASQTFHDNRKRLPPAFGFSPRASVYGGAGLGTTFFHLLPFLDQSNLYDSARYRPPNTPQQDYYLYTANNVHRTAVAAFTCPSDPSLPARGVNPKTRYAGSSYAGNYLVFGVVDAGYASVQGTYAETWEYTYDEKNQLLSAKQYDADSGRARCCQTRTSSTMPGATASRRILISTATWITMTLTTSISVTPWTGGTRPRARESATRTSMCGPIWTA